MSIGGSSSPSLSPSLPPSLALSKDTDFLELDLEALSQIIRILGKDPNLSILCADDEMPLLLGVVDRADRAVEGMTLPFAVFNHSIQHSLETFARSIIGDLEIVNLGSMCEERGEESFVLPIA
jgi:hypothetical protein